MLSPFGMSKVLDLFKVCFIFLCELQTMNKFIFNHLQNFENFGVCFHTLVFTSNQE